MFILYFSSLMPKSSARVLIKAIWASNAVKL
ncbi:hypothetical protein EROM_110940 [Encephalitozoon romaleae SJ-2008]|uniref:Uncharacterized protein n=1 Tax=Encephalitozoon romaleae (strain SJ-2008) TaxID=1178016 RepID=I6ZWD3_ENCRO|nr:hypothetical protein EROM_110940 [Encephalitozoon romaleae SJ-2008]AFN84076.1 hypothetical protein EROM_110940 [Encephalitozoon romaleae SJ-2008]